MVLAGLELLAEAAEWRTAVWLTKPLLMPVLGWAFQVGVRREGGVFSNRIRMALLFSWLGDVWLMMVPTLGPAWFLYGLGGFLLAHGSYMLAFSGWSAGRPGWLRRRPWAAAPLVVYLVLLTAWWWSSLGGYRWPVVVYSLFITAMGLTALNLRERVPADIYRMLVAGAVLFILSDSLIAVDKFRQSVPGAGIWIMLTYTAAQYLLVRAAVGMVVGRRGREQA